MELGATLRDLQREVRRVTAPDFTTDVHTLKSVPSLHTILKESEAGETPTSFIAHRLRTTVLYIDLRRSVEPGYKQQAAHKTKVYIAFLRAIVNAASAFGGKVCNVSGDRVMVLFDPKNCYVNAVYTAFLLNTVAEQVLKPNFPHRILYCGIGIDYGRVLLSKIGVSAWSEDEKPFNSLVWLGKPTQRAARITDAANRSLKEHEGVERITHYYRRLKEWSWRTVDMYGQVFSVLGSEPEAKRRFEHAPDLKLIAGPFDPNRTEPILVSGRVYKGFAEAMPDDPSLRNMWWRRRDLGLPGSFEGVFGVDALFEDATLVNGHK